MAANIRGILLAAGSAKRFGSNKLLHALPPGTPDAGVPVGLAAARHLIGALPDSIAVLRPRAQKLGKLLRDAGCNTVVCKNAGEGMGTSLAAGVRAAADAHGWVVALADMPFLHPETIRVIAKALADGAAIAAPTWAAVVPGRAVDALRKLISSTPKPFATRCPICSPPEPASAASAA